MSPEREWGYFYHCTDCRKDFDEVGGRAHTSLGHKVTKYITGPKEVDRRTAPENDVFTIEEIIKTDKQHLVLKDLADVEEVETEDWEIGQ